MGSVLGGTMASKGGPIGPLQMVPQTQRAVKLISECTFPWPITQPSQSARRGI